MGRKLAKNVYVGETLYRADTEPPKEIAEQITNPAAWGDEAPKSERTSAPAEPATDPAPAAADEGEPKPAAKKTAAKKTAAKKTTQS